VSRLADIIKAKWPLLLNVSTHVLRAFQPLSASSAIFFCDPTGPVPKNIVVGLQTLSTLTAMSAKAAPMTATHVKMTVLALHVTAMLLGSLIRTSEDV